MTSHDTQDRDGVVGGALTVALLITSTVQNAVPPMATDTYSAAFPQITVGLTMNSTTLGFTFTTFFVGYASDQVLGGTISDQIGRRRPIIAGGIIAPVGSMICVFTPNIWVLLVGQVFQGLDGGVASSVACATPVDVAYGKTLTRAMSLLQATVGFAPILVPALGALIITHATWRVVFWTLAVFTLFMAVFAWFVIHKSLPEERRHPGGIPRFSHGPVQVVRIRLFVGLILTNAFSSFCMFGYISNVTYVLQGSPDLSPMAFAWVSTLNALLPTGFALVNVRLTSHLTPRTFIITGLTIAATGVVTLAILIFLLDLPPILTCMGFALVMTANALIFGDSAAQAMSEAREHVGTASSVMGMFQLIVNGIVAPLAISGGDSAAPMVFVVIVSSAGAWSVFWVTARSGKHTPRQLNLD